MSATLGLTSGAWAVVFTDVAASTVLRVRLGDDEADRVFATHDRLVRARIAAAGGLVVKSTGDGLMAAFRSAAEAITAAVSVQQAVEAADELRTVGLAVRIGISAGDVAQRAGDLQGIAVIEAARLCDRAESGEILASETARLVAGTRGGHEFIPRGPLDLKGLGAPVNAFVVPWASADDVSGGPPLAPARFARPGLVDGVLMESAPFVGRQDLFAKLEDGWQRSDSGAVHMLVVGPAGIGKTALVVRFAGGLRETGAVVLWGVCDAEMMLPFQPWVQAIRPVAASVAHRLGPLATDLALALPLPGIEPRAGHGVDDGTLRHRLCEALLAVLAEVSTSGRLCLVLDDLHWADPLTLTMIRFAARQGSELPLLVLGLTRDEGTAATPGLDWDRLELGGLERHDVAELVRAWLPSSATSDEDIERLVHATGGNPFFLTETVRAASSGPGGSGDLLETVPQSVQAVLAGRLQRLSDRCLYLLTIASVVGEDFAIDDLTTLVNRSPESVLEALQPAVDESVIVETTVLDRFRFDHDLVRRHLLDAMTASRRAHLHWAVADQRRDVRAPDAVVQRAEHLLVARDLVDIKELTEAVLAAGSALQHTGGFEQAASLYGETREIAHASGDQVAEARLAATHGKVLAALEQPFEAQQAFDRAALLARSLQAPTVVVETALSMLVFDPQVVPSPEKVDVLRDAVRLLENEDSLERVRALTQLSLIEMFLGNQAASGRLLDEASQCAERLDTAAARVEVSHIRHLKGRAQGEPVATTLARSREAVDLAVAAGDRQAEARARGELMADALEAGDLDLAYAVWADYATLVEQTRDPVGRWIAATGRAVIAQAGGDLDLSDRLAGDAHELGNRLDVGLAGVGLGSHLFVSSWLRGTLASVADEAEAFAVAYPDLPVWSVAVALAKAKAGDTTAAQSVLERVGPLDNLVEDYLRPATLILATEAAVTLDDHGKAELLRGELEPFQDRCIVVSIGFAMLGPVQRCLGLIESLIGVPTDAVELLVDSAGSCRQGGMHAWAERSLSDATDVARHHGLPQPLPA